MRLHCSRPVVGVEGGVVRVVGRKVKGAFLLVGKAYILTWTAYLRCIV